MSSPTDRLLGLLSMLQVRREWSGAALSQRLGVSARTVRRDVDRLRAMGYRIEAAKGPAGGYRLEAGSELPPMRFDDAQAVAIAVALRTVSVTGAVVAEDALRALATVRQVLPAPLRHRVDALEVSTLDASGAVAVDPGVVAFIEALDPAALGDDDFDGLLAASGLVGGPRGGCRGLVVPVRRLDGRGPAGPGDARAPRYGAGHRGDARRLCLGHARQPRL